MFESINKITQGVNTVFIAVITAISIIFLAYLSIWGYQKENLRALSVGFIFGFLLIMALIVFVIASYNSVKKTRSSGDFWDFNWRIPSSLFTIGLFTALAMVTFSRGDNDYSTLGIGLNSLMSTFSQQMPRVFDFLTNALMVPLIEEAFWIYFIPILVVTLMTVVGTNTKAKFFANNYFMLFMVVVISSITFVIFHVGQQGNFSFKVSAFIFRTVLIILVWGDALFDWVPYFQVFPAFAIGFHVGNNWGIYGFLDGIEMLFTHIFGVLLFILLIYIFISLPDYLIRIIRGDAKLVN